MKRFALSLAVFLAAGLSLSAQSVDRARIRAAVSLPEVSCMIKMGWDDSGARDERGKRTDHAANAARYRARLNGSAADGETYIRLAVCYAALKDEPRRLDACRRAEQVLHPYRDTNDPQKAQLVAQYASAVRALGGAGNAAHGEEYARRAVRLDPKNWYCHEELGWTCVRKIVPALCGEELSKFDMNKFMHAITRQRPGPAQLDAATRALDEARVCFAEVYRLAPRKREALMSCFNFVASDQLLTRLLDGLSGRAPGNAANVVVSAGRLAAELAELCPDDICWQAQAATFTVLADLAKTPTGAGAISKVSPECRKALRKYFERLEKGTQNADAEAAAYCHTMIATLCFITNDESGFFRHARRAVLLDPSLSVIGEALEAKLLERDDPSALTVSRDRLRRNPTARNYFLTAKTLTVFGRLGEAEWLLRTAVELHPGDLYCTLGLAATLLQSERDEALLEAKELLLRGYRMVRPDTPSNLQRDGAMLWVALQALSGNRDNASQLLRRWEQLDSQNERIRKLRDVVGPEHTVTVPPPQPLIIPAGLQTPRQP